MVVLMGICVEFEFVNWLWNKITNFTKLFRDLSDPLTIERRKHQIVSNSTKSVVALVAEGLPRIWSENNLKKARSSLYRFSVEQSQKVQHQKANMMEIPCCNRRYSLFWVWTLFINELQAPDGFIFIWIGTRCYNSSWRTVRCWDWMWRSLSLMWSFLSSIKLETFPPFHKFVPNSCMCPLVSNALSGLASAWTIETIPRFNSLGVSGAIPWTRIQSDELVSTSLGLINLGDLLHIINLSGVATAGTCGLALKWQRIRPSWSCEVGRIKS